MQRTISCSATQHEDTSGGNGEGARHMRDRGKDNRSDDESSDACASGGYWHWHWQGGQSGGALVASQVTPLCTSNQQAIQARCIRRGVCVRCAMQGRGVCSAPLSDLWPSAVLWGRSALGSAGTREKRERGVQRVAFGRPEAYLSVRAPSVQFPSVLPALHVFFHRVFSLPLLRSKGTNELAGQAPQSRRRERREGRGNTPLLCVCRVCEPCERGRTSAAADCIERRRSRAQIKRRHACHSKIHSGDLPTGFVFMVHL
jgi:hypothetical protein